MSAGFASLEGVAITGLGVVTAAGCGRDTLAAALVAGVPLARPVDRSAGWHRPGGSHCAATVDPKSLQPWLSPMAARRMSPPSRFAVVALRRALEDAGLDAATLRAGQAARPTAVFAATACGPSSYTERILEQIQEEGPEAVSPSLFTESVANAPAAQIALACGALGPNVTITQREVGPLLALRRGALEIAEGRAEQVLVAVVEELTPMEHSVFDRFGCLADAPRPFDRHRRGYLAAEGAAVLLLEREDVARARGASIKAWVRAALAAFDPAASLSDYSRDPTPLAAALARGLERAGVEVATVDRIVSGASGMPTGDRLEGLVLRRVWGSATPSGTLPPILAPKGVVGEGGGGHLAAALLAAEGYPFGPTAGFATMDPELMITPHDGGSLPPARRLLVSALAVGGAAAWVVLEKGEG